MFSTPIKLAEKLVVQVHTVGLQYTRVAEPGSISHSYLFTIFSKRISVKLQYVMMEKVGH